MCGEEWGGSGGSLSPWQLWQPGICSPTELGVQQLNPYGVPAPFITCLLGSGGDGLPAARDVGDRLLSLRG